VKSFCVKGNLKCQALFEGEIIKNAKIWSGHSKISKATESEKLKGNFLT
jgi:hypothetical protein